MYSPELNPCELVFAFVKNFICNYCTPSLQLFDLMLCAFCDMSYRAVVACFEHCVNIKERITA